jgi:predicted aspartyl protease
MIMGCRAATVRGFLTSGSKPFHHGLASMSTTKTRALRSWSRPAVFPTFPSVVDHWSSNHLSGSLKVRSGPHCSSFHSALRLFSTSCNFVEINDVLLMGRDFKPVKLEDFDIPLHDIEAEMIRKMEIDGVKHLSPADHISPSNPTTTMNGIQFADHRRVFVRAVVSSKGKAVNAFMLVDTSSPYTFLTEETIMALGLELYGPPDNQDGFVGINGYHVLRVRVSKGGFKDVNILGTDFLKLCDLHVNYRNGTARITMGPI